MTNQAISIIKDTSQVAAIAVMDMMKVAAGLGGILSQHL